jgi:hypothetical protein
LSAILHFKKNVFYNLKNSPNCSIWRILPHTIPYPAAIPVYRMARAGKSAGWSYSFGMLLAHATRVAAGTKASDFASARFSELFFRRQAPRSRYKRRHELKRRIAA